jgi:hypothetical protein
MTIGIAAICKIGGEPAIIAATDHLISTSLSGSSFTMEPDIPKYFVINSHTILLTSGSHSICSEVAKELASIAAPEEQVPLIADTVQKIMGERLQKGIELSIFKPRQIDVKDYYVKSKSNEFPSLLAFKIEQEVEEFELKASVIVAGLDYNGAHILSVNEKRFPLVSTDAGFSAIGAGEVQALDTLIRGSYSSNNEFEEAVYSVFRAKKDSENALGVGKKTTLVVITCDGIKEIPQDVIKKLEIMLEKEKKQSRKLREKIIKQMREEKILLNGQMQKKDAIKGGVGNEWQEKEKSKL